MNVKMNSQDQALDQACRAVNRTRQSDKIRLNRDSLGQYLRRLGFVAAKGTIPSMGAWWDAEQLELAAYVVEMASASKFKQAIAAYNKAHGLYQRKSKAKPVVDTPNPEDYA